MLVMVMMADFLPGNISKMLNALAESSSIQLAFNWLLSSQSSALFCMIFSFLLVILISFHFHKPLTGVYCDRGGKSELGA